MGYSFNTLEEQDSYIVEIVQRVFANLGVGLGKVTYTELRSNMPTCVSIDMSSIHNQCLDVNICYEDIDKYIQASGNSFSETIYKLVAHEILHVVCEVKDETESWMNPAVVNLAQDLEINSNLGIEADYLITPSRLGFPPNLQWKQYYKLLEARKAANDKKKREEAGSSSRGGQSRGGDTTGAQNRPDVNSGTARSSNQGSFNINDYLDKSNTTGLKSSEEPFQECGNEAFAEEYSDVIKGVKQRDYNNRQDKVLKTAKGFDLDKRFAEIFQLIRNRETEKEIVKTSKRQSWMKYNNRRQNSGYLSPGRVIKNQGATPRFSDSATVFVDVSWSTMLSHGGAPLLWCLDKISKKLHDLGCTIVFYNTSVVDVIKPCENFRYPGYSGGTAFLRAWTEFTSQKAPQSKRVYVITDGFDNSLEKVVSGHPDYSFTIWEIHNNGSFSKLY